MTQNIQKVPSESKKDLRDADTCTALGLGVGALGVSSALLAGAVCPLCYFIAPGLIAVGVGKRWITKRNQKNQISRIICLSLWSIKNTDLLIEQAIL